MDVRFCEEFVGEVVLMFMPENVVHVTGEISS